MRFCDIAVIVNSAGRALYLRLIDAVFAACHNLPCSVSHLTGKAGSFFIEAMGLLREKLPFGHFSRTEMLTLLTHSAVSGGLDGLLPEDMAAMCEDMAAMCEDMAAMCENLGIVFGADRIHHVRPSPSYSA